MKKYWAIASGLWIVDRLTKYWAEAVLRPRGVQPAIPWLFQFAYAQNTGVAFSMLSGQSWMMPVLTGLVLVGLALMYLLGKHLTPVARGGLLLAFMGGLGNLIDRVIFGYVIDFIDLTFISFAIFNVADMMICVGAVLACVGVCLGPQKEAQ